MITRQRLHQLIDAVPENELPSVLEALATNAALARAYILSSPSWMAAIEDARRQKEAGIPFTPGKEVFASLRERDRQRQHDA